MTMFTRTITQPTYEMTPQLNVKLFVNDKIARLPPSITPNVTKKKN